MTKEIIADTYIGREQDKNSCKDVYYDSNSRLFYTIPIMTFREMKRLSDSSEELIRGKNDK